MTDNEKILSMLENITTKVDKLEQGQSKIQADIKTIKSDVSDIKAELKVAWHDIVTIDERTMHVHNIK